MATALSSFRSTNATSDLIVATSAFSSSCSSARSEAKSTLDGVDAAVPSDTCRTMDAKADVMAEDWDGVKPAAVSALCSCRVSKVAG